MKNSKTKRTEKMNTGVALIYGLFKCNNNGATKDKLQWKLMHLLYPGTG